MIIIGYQGIGKSTLAGKNNGVIDLESGNFWHNGKRPDDWYVYYCQIAEHLSQQGYIVFTSSHEVVRNRLKKYSKERLCVIYPCTSLKDEWIGKLKERYNNSGLDKDFKAMMNAMDRYCENIEELKECGIEGFEIKDMNYKLNDIVDFLMHKSPATLEVRDNNIRKELLTNLYEDGFFVNEDVLDYLIEKWCNE